MGVADSWPSSQTEGQARYVLIILAVAADVGADISPVCGWTRFSQISGRCWHYSARDNGVVLLDVMGQGWEGWGIGSIGKEKRGQARVYIPM